MRSKARAKRLGGRALAVALGLIVGAMAIPSCGTDAVGIEACRQIEQARCEASVACGFTPQQVTDCETFYHDQCLHGIENASAGEPDSVLIAACVSDINKLGACAAHVPPLTMADCMVQLTPGVDAGAVMADSPCDVLQHQPEVINSCAFVVEPADAGAGGGSGGASPDVFIL